MARPAVVTAVLDALVAPFGAVDVPTGPTDSPALWVVLAAVRRQFGQSTSERDAVAVAASTQTSQPLVAAAAANTPPTAVNDGPITIAKDTPKTLTAAQLVANDTDPDGGTLAVNSVGTAVNGTVILNADGTVKFTPTTGYTGAASFNYRVKDATGAVSAGVAKVSLTVVAPAANAAPTAVNDGPIAVTKDTAKTITAAQLVGNDTDPNPGDVLKVSAVGSAVNGTVVLNADGTVKFTPTAGYTGAAQFNYRVKDAAGAVSTNVATVSLTVTAGTTVNQAPTAVNDGPIAVTKDTAKTITAAQLVGNDTDPNPGDTLKVSAVGSAVNGTVVLNADGTVKFTPTAGYTGAAQFNYRVKDAAGAVSTNVATVSLTVAAPAGNQAPTAVNDGPIAVTKDTAKTITAAQLVGNDTDPNPGDTLKVSAVGSAVNGTVVLNADGTVKFTPTAGYTGTGASFNYRVKDAAGAVSAGVAKVSITVSAPGVSVNGTVTLGGQSYDAVFNDDGSRAVVTTTTSDGAGGYTTAVSVINPATGAKVGNTTTLNGESGYVRFNAGGTRAVVTADIYGDSIDDATNVAVFDTTTGVQIGTTISLTGNAYADDALQFVAGGTRAVIVTSGIDAAGKDVAKVVVVNTVTGARLGAIGSFAGTKFGPAPSNSLQLNAGGTRLVVTSTDVGATATAIVRVVVINTDTGAQLANNTYDGTAYSPSQLSADGTRAVLLYGVAGSTAFDSTSKVTILNLTTGAQVGATLSRSGGGAAALNADGSRLVFSSSPTTDGATYTTNVAIINTATGAQIGTSATFGGAVLAPAQFNADQSRAVLTAFTPQVGAPGNAGSESVVVINTSTGAQVGSAVTVVGSPGTDLVDGTPSFPRSVQLNADGSRALITTVTGPDVGDTTRVAVVNTVTGTQVGTTVILTGTINFGDGYRSADFNSDGSRVVVSTLSGAADTGFTTRFAIVNTSTGAQLGTTRTLAGGPADGNGNVVFNAPGNRVLLITYAGDDTTGYTSRTILVNATTGAQVGVAGNYVGSYPFFASFSADGTRLVVISDTNSDTNVPAIKKIIVFDTSTGAQVGATSTFSGSVSSFAYIDDDPARAIITTVSGDETAGYTSQVVVLDVQSATQIGTTLTLGGNGYLCLLSEDGSRAIVTTVTGNDAAGYTTKVNSLQIV